jgi:hypothetical protein
MTSNDVLKRIKDLSRRHSFNTPYHIPIEELAIDLNFERKDLIAYLVDLKIAGHVEFDRNSVYLSDAAFLALVNNKE